jgi:hypothetical protein
LSPIGKKDALTNTLSIYYSFSYTAFRPFFIYGVPFAGISKQLSFYEDSNISPTLNPKPGGLAYLSLSGVWLKISLT